MADEFGQRSPKTNGYLNNIQVYDDDSPAVMDEPVVSYAASVPTVVSHSDPAMTPDVQNGFGLPGGYNNQALRLAHEETVSDQNAMNYLRQALNDSNEVTPTQGFAAALLAAIPTLGGYMIGKSVGNPDIPEGVYGLKPTMDSGAAGGLMGAQLGGTSANSFLASIGQEGEKKREIYQKMAAIESQKANRLDSQQAQIISAGLAAQEREAMIPLEEASRIRIAQASREGRQPTMMDLMSPEQRAALIAKQTGVNADGTPFEKPDKFTIPADMQNKLAQEYSFIKEGETLVPELRNLKSWDDLQSTKLGTSFDKEGLQARLSNLVDVLARARSGAALSKEENAMYQQMIQGDMSGTPTVVANTLSKLLEADRRMGSNRIDALSSFSDPESAKALFAAPTPQSSGGSITGGGVPQIGGMFNGSKVLKITKVK